MASDISFDFRHNPALGALAPDSEKNRFSFSPENDLFTFPDNAVRLFWR